MKTKLIGTKKARCASQHSGGKDKKDCKFKTHAPPKKSGNLNYHEFFYLCTGLHNILGISHSKKHGGINYLALF
jgi:hypothetical protein